MVYAPNVNTYIAPFTSRGVELLALPVLLIFSFNFFSEGGGGSRGMTPLLDGHAVAWEAMYYSGVGRAQARSLFLVLFVLWSADTDMTEARQVYKERRSPHMPRLTASQAAQRSNVAEHATPHTYISSRATVRSNVMWPRPRYLLTRHRNRKKNNQPDKNVLWGTRYIELSQEKYDRSTWCIELHWKEGGGERRLYRTSMAVY